MVLLQEPVVAEQPGFPPPSSYSPTEERILTAALGLIGAGLAAPFIRSSRAEAVWPEQTTIPDILKGSGEVRIATFGGTMQETQRKAYFEPFEKATGIKVVDFAGSDPTKIKAMVETKNIEWDMAQLSRGSILNLMKTGDYFEKIDYSLVDDGVGKEYRFEYGLEMLVWAQVLGYRTDSLKGAVPTGWADFWDTKKFPGDRALVGTGNGGWPEMIVSDVSWSTCTRKVGSSRMKRLSALASLS